MSWAAARVNEINHGVSGVAFSISGEAPAFLDRHMSFKPGRLTNEKCHQIKCHSSDPALQESSKCSTETSYCYSNFYVLACLWTQYSHFCPPLGLPIIRMQLCNFLPTPYWEDKKIALLYSPQTVKHSPLANVLAINLLPWLLHMHSMNFHP